MIVYGDRSEHADPRARLLLLSKTLAGIGDAPAGARRHAGLVAAFIDAAMLLQGLADADFALAGCDRATPTTAAMTDFVMDLAHAVRRSWDSRFAAMPDLPPVPQLDALPASVELRVAEGYAFYALYPEAYLIAARCLKLEGPPRVVGVRSIGAGLAALVAAELDAPPPVTVRPTGHPFDRRIALTPELAGDLLSEPSAHFVIVDEGPGLSGSSFGAVADWLEERRVPADRIAFLPSHGGDLGPQACQRHQRRWAAAQRAPADIGPHLPELLADWAADLLGPLDAPLRDISGGAWRALRYQEEACWPASNANQERRKFLARAGGETWLLKFAGLGREGEHKLTLARTLHAAGWVPEPRGLLHGFLAERWYMDARVPTRVPLDRLSRYLGARVRLPAGGDGATMADLLAMARHNTELSLGPARATSLDRWRPRLQDLAERAQPVATDNRLDLHEWLQLPDGRLLKADALDHHTAHDLTGCQDIAWDVAGAAVEFELSRDEVEALHRLTAAAAGRPISSELIAFMIPCYTAFRLGQATLAAASQGGWPAEAARLGRQAERYAERLDRLLGA